MGDLGQQRVADLDDTRAEAAPVALHEIVARTYDQHGASLFRYALMILANRAAAEDAVQQAFTKVLGQDSGGAALECPVAYLRTAVRNECYTALRRRRREPEAAQEPELLEAVAPRPADEGERRALERALRALSPEQREVLHLKVYEGWTFRELAAIWGESINTVASRYRYGLDKLRARLKFEGYGR